MFHQCFPHWKVANCSTVRLNKFMGRLVDEDRERLEISYIRTSAGNSLSDFVTCVSLPGNAPFRFKDGGTSEDNDVK